MASTDATPFPIKNQAYRVTFPILDADGDLVTAAGSLDSEVSKDGGTFADCTNEATEIATSSGMYYLDLTSTEMNADTVAIIVKSTGGKTTPIVLYPVQLAVPMLGVNVEQWNNTAVPAEDTVGYPKVTIKDGTGAGEIDTASGAIVQVNQLGTQAKADVNAEVLDVLNVDTFAEIGQETPAATQTLRKMIAYLYKAWRNKKTQTSSQYSLLNDDAATVDQKATVSDDGTTTTIGEVATGP